MMTTSGAALAALERFRERLDSGKPAGEGDA